MLYISSLSGSPWHFSKQLVLICVGEIVESAYCISIGSYIEVIKIKRKAI